MGKSYQDSSSGEPVVPTGHHSNLTYWTAHIREGA